MSTTKCQRSIKQKQLDELSDEDLIVVRETTQALATGLQKKLQRLSGEVRKYQRRVARLDGEIKRRARAA